MFEATASQQKHCSASIFAVCGDRLHIGEVHGATIGNSASGDLRQPVILTNLAAQRLRNPHRLAPSPHHPRLQLRCCHSRSQFGSSPRHFCNQTWPLPPSKVQYSSDFTKMMWSACNSACLSPTMAMRYCGGCRSCKKQAAWHVHRILVHRHTWICHNSQAECAAGTAVHCRCN